LSQALQEIKSSGLYKDERVITTSQKAVIKVSTGQEVLNFCSNNYLGLSNNPVLINAAKDALDKRGFGMSSVRFICGTQDLHIELERKNF
jgi:glycine C-acetyltransferase